MKKILIPLIIVSVLLIANFYVSEDSEENIVELKILNFLEDYDFFDIRIQKDNRRLEIKNEKNCYEIVPINYCADDKKIALIKTFLSMSKVKAEYEINEENLRRLGFDKTEHDHLIVINGKKILKIGKVNDFNEVYLLADNRRYKVQYNQGLSDISTKKWISKAIPIVNYPNNSNDSPLLSIKIYKPGKYAKEECRFERDEMVLYENSDPVFSNVRNTFRDLYPDDVIAVSAEEMNEIYGPKGNKRSILIRIHEDTKNILPKYKNFPQPVFRIWKSEHLVYMAKSSDRMQGKNIIYKVPNVVYDNLNTACEKYNNFMK